MSDSTNETIGETETPNHGWLEQFEAMTKESLTALEGVVKQGLLPLENEVLIQFAAKLIKLAEVHDPEALSKVEALLT